MIIWLISVTPLFICRLLGVPVPYARLFPGMNVRHIKGQILLGDSAMPATVIEGASTDRNLARNAWLATTTRKTWTVFRVREEHKSVAYIMYGTDQVILTRLRTVIIGVRNGKEGCRFAALDDCGAEIAFEVICRGNQDELERGLRPWLVSNFLRVPSYPEPALSLVTFI